jgi:chemosensory pili system protein ChpA (sensor histidine kinase/response regulator)
MDSAINQGQAGDDLSALAWVHGELRRSLEAANRALRRYLKEAETASASEVDAVDPAVLRTARNQLHQGVGALELVGFPAVANVLRASEAAVQRMVSKPALVTPAAVDTVEKVSFALLDFLSRQLAGKPISPVALFPQYRAVQQLAGADRIHPADLWKIDWQWHELPPEPGATPRHADEEARGMMETLVLGLMRSSAGTGSTATLKALSDLCADLSAGARAFGGAPHLITFWQLAAAAFEAQAQGLLPGDNYTKRIASRLLAQVRPREGSPLEVSDRLAADLLFFCSHAKAPEPGLGRQAPRLAAVRKVWQLKSQPTADYETPRLGRFDPAVLVLARKRVAAAKDSWSAVAGGELHRLAGLPEQFSLVGESLQRLLPGGEGLAAALQAAVTRTVNSGLEPPAPLAMEVATGILYLDASLEDGEFDHPELAERVQRLSQRIDAVREGAEPQPLDVWMEELYRRVSDRQTMGSVVQELRASLSEVEKQIDQYFRDPSQRQLLIPVPAQLSSMRGVLSVLGLDQASAAALHMRDDVDALAQTEVDPQRAVQTGTFDRLADNLGALSFLIDMLSVQPALAKSLFRFDPATGALSAVMGQTERTSAFSAFDDTAPVTRRPRCRCSTSCANWPCWPPSRACPTSTSRSAWSRCRARPSRPTSPSWLACSAAPRSRCVTVPTKPPAPVCVPTWPRPWLRWHRRRRRPSPPAHRCRRPAPRLPPVPPASKTTPRCATSSSRKRRRSSPTPAPRSSAWPMHPTTPPTSPPCGAPSTRSRAARAWWACPSTAKAPGPASSCTTPAWPARRAWTPRCACSAARP